MNLFTSLKKYKFFFNIVIEIEMKINLDKIKAIQK